MSESEIGRILDSIGDLKKEVKEAFAEIQKIAAGQEYCPMHGKTEEIVKLLTDLKSKGKAGDSVRSNLISGIIGIGFAIVTILVTLFISGKIKP